MFHHIMLMMIIKMVIRAIRTISIISTIRMRMVSYRALRFVNVVYHMEESNMIIIRDAGRILDSQVSKTLKTFIRSRLEGCSIGLTEFLSYLTI